MTTDVQEKIRKVRDLLQEITKDPEYRNAMRNLENERLSGKATTRGTCFNGCAPCLPCLPVPEVMWEVYVGFTIYEFH